MRVRGRKILLSLTSVALILGVTLAPATANDADLIGGGQPPAGWTVDPDAYSSMFGPLGQNAPQGTVIADSGFRPYPHGFPIPNWGTSEDFIDSQIVYGVPERLTLQEARQGDFVPPSSLNSLSLRRTFGDGVCRDPKTINPRTGSCELIFGAELLAEMVETAALGGHCFGMAASAAALYNGQLPANQVGASGLGINAANPMRQPAVQSITRLFGTQLFSPAIQSAAATSGTPTDVVNTLIRELPGGTVPYILTLMNSEGGHGITPFAVLDRGQGVYDIAVYDNNYPMRARAVTVNTNDNSFAYNSAVNPSAPGLEWSTATDSVLALVPVAETLETQPCPVCLGADQGTLVAITSLNADNQDQILLSLLGADGQPLSQDDFQIISPLNPPTKEHISQPVIWVNPGVEFGILVQTGKLASKQSLEIYAMSNGESQYVLLDELRNNSISIFGVGENGKAIFESNVTSSPRILQLSDQPKVSFDVNGHPLNLPAGVTAHQEWNTKTERIVYRSTAKKALKWNIQVGGLDNAGGREYVGIGVTVPAGGKLLVDYTGASATKAPLAWVRDSAGNRTPITLQPVTEQLINEYRDQLYVATGPN